jgi:hypothetical protein
MERPGGARSFAARSSEALKEPRRSAPEIPMTTGIDHLHAVHCTFVVVL